NCIIATLVMMNSPAECRLILIDNKGGVEFTHWRELPHLLTPMVKIVDNVLPALQLAEKMMHRRLAMLEAVKAKDITAYNKRVATSEQWARVVVVIDELATILDQGPLTKEIHASMKVLTAMGRACGIHMVMCTQYSGVDVLPGPIKANLAARMSGAMPDGSASMTVLGTHEAKELQRIPGRMLIAVGADSKEIQTAYISDFDIEQAVIKAKEYGPAPDVPELQGDELDTEGFIPVKVFGVKDVLDLALDELNGQLSAQKMHKLLDIDSPGEKALKRFVKRIQDTAPIEHNGQIYGIKKLKRAYYLTPQSAHTDNQPTHTEGPNEDPLEPDSEKEQVYA
ncbi:partial DNA translocase FtsK, partial [Anaerolineae bacterium]